MTNSIQQYYAFAPRKVRGTNVERGQPLYAIYNEETKLYFIWAYTNKEFAEKMLTRVEPTTPVDMSTNWRKSLQELLASERKDFT